MAIELDDKGGFVVRSQLAGVNIDNQVNAIHPVPPPPHIPATSWAPPARSASSTSATCTN